MIVRILLAGILAGFLAGVFTTGAQAVKIWPLIVEAEKYENAADQTIAGSENAEPWGPQDGPERMVYSLISNVITGVAYALILTAAILVSRQAVTLQSGLVWGTAGFVAVMLAPSLGLPPEVPGTVAAGVAERQIWWSVTVVMSAAGLAVFAFQKRWYWIGPGIVLMVAPHLYGAPVPELHASAAPAWITAEFVVATIVVSAMFWLVLGGALGWLLNRTLTKNAWAKNA